MAKFKDSYVSYLMMYLFYYMSFALFSVLISVYMLDNGYSSVEVSFTMSMSMIFSLIAQPIIGYFSDLYDQKKMNMCLLFLAIFLAIGFIFSKNLLSLSLFYSGVLLIINGVNPVIEKMATTSRFRYGSIRVWGTIGYAIGAQISGIIYQYINPAALFTFFIVTVILCILGLYGTKEREKTGFETTKTVPDNSKNGSMKAVLTNRVFLIYLLIASIFYGVTNVASTYIPPMLVTDGLSVNLSTTVIFFATLMELPVVFFSHKFMSEFSNKILLLFVFGLITIQCFTYAFIPNLAIKIMLTLLCKHVAGMLFIMLNLKIVLTIIPKRFQIIALSLIATFKNLSSIIFQNIGGQILNSYSYNQLFMILFIVILAGLIIVSFFKVPTNERDNLFE